jgi:hypothetical protein
MWPSVPKIIPEKQLGTAYAVIFWIQNIGLLFIPLILGIVLNSTNPDVSPNKVIVKTAIEKAFNETLAGHSFTDREINKAVDKATGSAVDSIVQYTVYEPVSIEDVDTKYVENEIYLNLSQTLKTIDLTGDKKIVLKKITEIGKQNAYVTIEKERLNIRYNYFYDMVIFLSLSILSLLFAFLLKAEDKKKGYGLELPNIQK